MGLKDLNQIEEAILAKIQERVHSRTTEETFLVKALRYQDLSSCGWLDFPKFSRALLPYSSGVSDKDVEAIFERYADQGSLPIRPFASEFVSGVRRDDQEAPEPMYQEPDLSEETLESIKVVYDQGPRGTTSLAAVVRRIRQLIARKGLRTAVDIVQHFYSADEDVDDQLDMYEFRQACRKAGLTFREAEEVSIFDACAETKGKIHLPTFLKLLHGEMSLARRSLVERAFAAVGGNPQDDQSVVSPGKLKEHFMAQAHPLVVRGELEPGYVLAEFLDTFSQLAHVLGGCENGMVSFADFLAYYDVVSSTVENDALFDLIVQRVWDVKTKAWADGEVSPRRLVREVDDAPSPTAEKRPPPHEGPSVYTMDSPRGPQEHHRRFGRGPQASAITKSSIVFADTVNTLPEVFQRLSRSISSRGLRGWLNVVQRFQHFDYRRNGTVMRLDWQRLCRGLGLGLSSEDQELIFKELSKKKKGQAMDYVECLRILRGDSLPEERAQAVDHLFQALGTDHVAPAELKRHFDASNAPQCLLRRKDPRQAEQELFDAVDFFSQGAPFDVEKFDEFFRMVSAVHEDDDEFRLMTTSAFNVQ